MSDTDSKIIEKLKLESKIKAINRRITNVGWCSKND
jgi:hypothetical protein